MSENVETPTVTSTETPDVTNAITAADKRAASLCELVMRQTGYSTEEALDKLAEHKNDILAIVREYMGASKEVVQPKTTVNQMIYSEMRGMMDNAATNHRQKKEIEEMKKEYQEMVIRQHAAASQRLRATIGVSNGNSTSVDTSANEVKTDSSDNTL